MNTSEDKKPKSIAIANTDRCQSRCITCGAWQTPDSAKEKELSVEEWKKIFDKMHNWLGEHTFIFSGGEPFMRDDIFELIEYAASLGTRVDVISNGLALKGKCEKLINSSLGSILFSLNSVKDPSIHMKTRGLENSFKRTMDVIQTLNYLNKKLQKYKTIAISTILMPENLDEVRPIAEFVKTEGIGVSFQLLDDGSAFITPPEVESNKKEHFTDTSQKALDAIDLMIELKKQDYPIYNSYEQLDAFKTLITNPKKIKEITCQVGYRNFAISPRGEARICFCLDSIGSIVDSNPEDLWDSEKAGKVREEILNCQRNCRLLNCNFES